MVSPAPISVKKMDIVVAVLKFLTSRAGPAGSPSQDRWRWTPSDGAIWTMGTKTPAATSMAAMALTLSKAAALAESALAFVLTT
jgi:hypothetical protein